MSRSPQPAARSSQPTALQARYVFPIVGPPIAEGVVTIEGERIIAVGKKRSSQPAVDLGNVALLPGLVNAHTHLELSDTPAPIGAPGMPLPTWIGHVLAYRRTQSPSDEPIARGLREAARTGTTTLADIAQPGWSQAQYESLRLDLVVLQELLGLSDTRVAPLYEMAEQHLARSPSDGFDWTVGLSPHAPYSLSMQIVRRACELAQPSATVAMHLAESPEELELLASGGGPFAALLQELGVWQPAAFPGRRRPLDYLELLSRAPRALVIHGNYLERDELAYLAARRERMALVYCPRTHSYFQHRRYPLAEALQIGVAVAIGTDSRASSPDLDLLAELRHLAATHPEIPLSAVLQLGTIAGAAALGRPNIGHLAPGTLANLTAVALADADREPHELLLHGTGRAVQSWYRGERLVPI